MIKITHAKIIDLWPSPGDLADGINKHITTKINSATVYKWRQRNSIPSGYWKWLLLSAKKLKIKVTAEMLIEGATK